MEGKKVSHKYSNLSMAVNGVLVRTNNWLMNARQKLILFARGYRGPTESDKAAFYKIGNLIPGFSKYEEAGLIQQLCKRATIKKFRGLEEYYQFLLENEDEQQRLSYNLTYMGTHFFRGNVWAELSEVCRKTFGTERKEPIRIWCAGCSTGKEVYSVLMMLLDFLPAENLDLIATDYNDEALAHCREGNYPLRTIDEIPAKYRHYVQTYKTPRSKDVEYAYRHQFQFRDKLREMVRTEHHNLLTDEYPAGFDLILCRNVIKFFTEDARTEIQKKLAQSLNEGGLLVLSEVSKERILSPDSMNLQCLSTESIYQKTTVSD